MDNKTHNTSVTTSMTSRLKPYQPYQDVQRRDPKHRGTNQVPADAQEYSKQRVLATATSRHRHKRNDERQVAEDNAGGAEHALGAF